MSRDEECQCQRIDNLVQLVAATFCVRGNIISPEHYQEIKDQLCAELLGWGLLGIEVDK